MNNLFKSFAAVAAICCIAPIGTHAWYWNLLAVFFATAILHICVFNDSNQPKP